MNNNIRYLILLTGLTVFISRAEAQITPAESEPESNEDIQTPDSILFDMPELLLYPPLREGSEEASLLERWHASYFFDPEDHCIDESVNPFFSDSVYRLRLNRMMTVIPMTYNETVRKCIDFYAGPRRKSLRYIMGMANFYFPVMEQILDRNGLPLELKFLSVVESALNPVAQSRVGASGLWQFMLPTGKIYGLEINSLIDERLDPEKATEAACRYFKDMYNRYGDWHLAIAAYNCGPGGVDKAIRRAGGATDFWKIFQFLPRETRAYVPMYIAAAYIMTYHCDHNICPVSANFSVATDTIMVERALHFDQIAAILQIDKEAVHFYNPQYKREIIPGNLRPSSLRLPIESTFAFIDRTDSIYTHRMEELLANCLPADANEPNSRQQRITHTTQTSETVVSIANLYGVTTQNLRKWNGLTGSRVAKGKKLTVYIDNGGLTFATPNTASAETTTVPQKPVAKSSVPATEKSSGFTSYQVKSGDSLYAIAKKYPGVTVQKIQDANGLTSTNLRIGQILKIPL